MTATATETKAPNDLNALAHYMLNLIGSIPASTEPQQADPSPRSRALTKTAAVNAGVTSGALALPAGPLGWLTVLPDVVAIWKIQAQLIADIAAVHGKSHLVSRENILYCLFRHSAALAVRELVVQVGNRVLVRTVSRDVIRAVVRKIGAKLTQKLVGETLSRLIPIVGAIGVGAFAYYDTSEVGKTALKLFAEDIASEAGQSKTVAFKASNGLYVCSDFSREAVVIADRSERLEWEQFKLVTVDAKAQTVGLLASNNCFVCCDGDRGFQLFANREKLEAWETFKLERISEQEVALRAHNSNFIYVNAERGNTLWADTETSGPAMLFSMDPIEEKH